MDCLTTDELLSILRIARSRSPRDWAMILLAYRHGLRASEVCTLRMTDVNLKDSSLSVQRLKGSLYTVQPLYRHRGQPLLDETKALQIWFQQRRPDGSDFLFLSQKGGRLHRSQFFRVFRHCTFLACLPPTKRHPHVLKHSLATHLVASNVNLALVGHCLGHRAIGSTMKYIGVSDSQACQAAQAALMNLY
jgi:site-specific recombinase XerD